MKNILLCGIAVVALTLGGAKQSEASLMISLADDNGHSATVTDLGAAGAVTFNGSIGNFAINVTTGLSKPAIGTATSPSLDLNSVDVTSQLGGKLTLEVTDTDFSGNGGPGTFLSQIGGTQSLGGTASYKTFLDCSDAAFGTGTMLSAQSFSSTPFAGGKNTNTTLCSGNYSLTEEVDLSLPGASSVASFDASVALPEPASLLLFGAGLIGLGVLSRRKRSA